jgi:uncharacterized protein
MKRALFLLAAVVFLSSCKKDDENETKAFDKGAMLINIADNVIIPSLNSYYAKVGELQTAFTALETELTLSNFEALRLKWKEAYLAYQSVKMFDFGPFRTYGYKGATETFPSDIDLIESNISSGSYNLASAGNTAAIGFSALDYLLYGNDAFTRLQNESNYRAYVGNVINKLYTETGAVVTAWSSYRNTFIASTGTETTSAFSEMVNEFNRDYELAKNAKLGIPIGIQSFGILLPNYIEARYSGISFELLRQSMVSLQHVYNGQHFNSSTNGLGFDDYLIHLEKSTLNSTINTRFAQILAKIDTFSGTLEEEMNSNLAELEALYQLIQGQVINIKTEMTSSFGVLITYQDNDGD